jgi:hypothetical protein
MVLAILGVITLATREDAYEKNRSSSRAATHQVHFWRVVAGRDESRGTIGDKLATDLRDYPKSPASFVGDSNSYGGVSGELGFRPMDSCNGDCGHLTSSTRIELQAAKKGNVPEVAPATAHGAPWIYWIGLLALFLAVPCGFLLIPRWRNRRRHETMSEQFPEETRLVDKLGATAKSLPTGKEQLELYGLQKRLQEELTERFYAGDSTKATLRTEGLKRDAKQALEALEAGNKTYEEEL